MSPVVVPRHPGLLPLSLDAYVLWLQDAYLRPSVHQLLRHPWIETWILKIASAAPIIPAGWPSSPFARRDVAAAGYLAVDGRVFLSTRDSPRSRCSRTACDSKAGGNQPRHTSDLPATEAARLLQLSDAAPPSAVKSTLTSRVPVIHGLRPTPGAPQPETARSIISMPSGFGEPGDRSFAWESSWGSDSLCSGQSTRGGSMAAHEVPTHTPSLSLPPLPLVSSRQQQQGLPHSMTGQHSARGSNRPDASPMPDGHVALSVPVPSSPFARSFSIPKAGQQEKISPAPTQQNVASFGLSSLFPPGAPAALADGPAARRQRPVGGGKPPLSGSTLSTHSGGPDGPHMATTAFRREKLSNTSRLRVVVKVRMKNAHHGFSHVLV